MQTASKAIDTDYKTELTVQLAQCNNQQANHKKAAETIPAATSIEYGHAQNAGSPSLKLVSDTHNLTDTIWYFFRHVCS